MSELYTEEDRLTYLVEKSHNFRRLMVEFDLVLDLTKQPPVTYRD